jgi:hypothetical protein
MPGNKRALATPFASVGGARRIPAPQIGRYRASNDILQRRQARKVLIAAGAIARASRAPQQFRLLGCVGGDAPRLVMGTLHATSWASSRWAAR